MHRTLILSLLILLAGIRVLAIKVTGKVTDDKGNALAYASILIKGTTRGVTAGNEGRYALDLAPGTYTLVCQYVGYTRMEKTITVGTEALTADFQLSPQQLSMAEVVVRPGGEDPAYAIIRHAIKKRKDYEMPLDSFTCEAYVKTQIRTRKLPDRLMGQRIQPKDKQDMGVDSAGKGIIYLSESLSKVAFKRPDKLKLEVLSGRESGSGGFGFSFPAFINFYNNNVNALDKLSPRGFVSPIADGALNYYRYKFLGSYFEDGREINKIQVIPRRKFEPLFSGTIEIVEGDWRIHSLDLFLYKTAQLQILDTVEIRQIHAPIDTNSPASSAGKHIWQVKDQVVYFTFNILGIDAVGTFLDVYNDYNPAPGFHKKFFNNVLIRYDTAGNKKTKAYWNSIRPLPLEPDEKVNYTIRDSIYEYNRDSMGTRNNRDSLLRRQGPVTAWQVLFTGFNRSDYRQPGPLHYSLEGLLPTLEYNTVEGINMELNGSFSRALKNGKGTLTFSPHLRYGFHNTRLNAWGELEWRRRNFSWNGDDVTSSRQTWSLSGGKRVSQYNPDNPISEWVNSLYTLFDRRNYMKIYENYFVQLSSTTRFDNGLRLNVTGLYENRMPIGNTTDYSLVSVRNRAFTPNFPILFPPGGTIQTLPSNNTAVLTSVDVQYQPGQQYIEFPQRKVSIGSKYPTMELYYERGWADILWSNANFDKWRFSVWDNVNFKLKGLLRFRFSVGGFLNNKSVYLQDYQHFDGNQTIVASEYLNSFQLAPYYANSTIANFYTEGHLEHHFNGLLTNKIPLFRRLNWNLVGGANAFVVNRDNNYSEVFGGLENIFKILRVDMVGSWLNGHYSQTGIRIGMGGLLGGMNRGAR